MVLSLKSQIRNSIRNKVGLCFRQDKESVITEETKSIISEFINCEVLQFDMHAKAPVVGYEREIIIDEYISIVSECRYVITDRLHCMLLCLITGTPCVALDNLTGKLNGVYKWINNVNYIKVVDSTEDVIHFMEKYSNNHKSMIYDDKSIDTKFNELATLFKG